MGERGGKGEFFPGRRNSMNSGVEEYNSMVCGKNYKHFNILRESRGR
jgi:hypothetical protein